MLVSECKYTEYVDEFIKLSNHDFYHVNILMFSNIISEV